MVSAIRTKRAASGLLFAHLPVEDSLLPGERLLRPAIIAGCNRRVNCTRTLWFGGIYARVSDNLYMFHIRRINGVGSHPIKGWNTPGPSMCLRGESKLDGGGAPDGAIPENIKHGWTLAGAIIGAVLWLSIEAITINNIRILYFDSEP